LDFVDQYRLSIEQGEAQCPHEFFSEVLDYTGGIPLYQEQLMKMAVHVGFSLDEAEQLRRIVGKKKVDKMPAWKAKIESKVRANNLPSEVADVLWSVAEDSANYSFNKSHSIAYATLAAWTAYLKFTYPQQFFLSLLKMTQFEPAPQEEIAKISQELSFFDIELLPPDLVKSSMDFALEGKDIRYGLNSIKGVSKKSLTALRDFRESETPTKFDIFIAAKQAGLNIGIVSALIQAGALSSYKTNRSLLVLEAQAFNVLTDREKRNILQLGEKYNYKLLDILVDARDGKLVGDDGRLLMTEKRFGTFKKKYVPYRDIYNQNKKYEKFANWYFETQLLGYSYSTKLKNVFAQDRYLLDSREAEDVELRREIKFIGTVEDSFKSTSRNGNDYLRLELGDDVGTLKGLFMNGNVRQANGGYRRIPRLDDYINDGNKLPEKGNIVMLRCTKGEDVFFIDELKVLDKKIYLKLSDLK
jgi:DNA polymerase III alpha subunit